MLNALVDILGAVLDRVSTLIVDHWIALLVVVLALSLRRLPWRRRALDGIPDAVALTLIVVTSVALSAGGAAIHGMPLPEYHDDFANLLDAGTLLQGRFSNPTHPLWPHFETMHVLQVPR